MSSGTSKHKALARREALVLADQLVSGLHETEDPVVYLAGALYPIIRARQKYQHSTLAARGILKARDRQVRFLLAASAKLHEQLATKLDAAAPKEAA